MNVIDYSKHFKKPNNNFGNHSPIFPKNIFCVMAGSTGSGKTNLMIHFLKEKQLLNYHDVYVYSSTLCQPSYEHLKEYYETLENFIKDTTGKVIKIANFLDADDEIVDPSMLNKDKNHIMIFDDVMLKDQTVIKEYFCKGRHNNVSVFYLCQSLHKIAKHCIRENANMFILFKQDDKTLKYFHETHISGDMVFNEFKSFCHKAWDKNHGFVVINLWDEAHCGRYWANYNAVYTPSQFR